MKHLSLLLITTTLVIACSKNNEPAPSSTSLKITVVDQGTAQPVNNATVTLFGNLADYQQGTNPVATKFTAADGLVTFIGLSSKIYYWQASEGCKTNRFSVSSTPIAITAGGITAINSLLSPAGTLKFVNNSSHPFKIEVNSVTLIAAQAGGSTSLVPMGTGAYTIKVTQLSGGTLQKTYSGTLACGATLTTAFP